MPAEKIEMPLYGGEVVLEFFPVAHRYKLKGNKEWITSVTSITGIIDKSKPLVIWALGLADAHLREYLTDRPDMVDKAELQTIIAEAINKHNEVRDQAASNGDLVHAYAESYARAKLFGEAVPALGEDLPDQVIAGINGFLDWVNTYKPKFIATERLTYSKKYGYAGLIDVIVEINGRRELWDYKTSKANKYTVDGLYCEQRYQVAAYRGSYEEENGKLDGYGVLRFDKETGEFHAIKLPESDYPSDFKAFLGCLEVKMRDKEITKLYGVRKEAK